VIDKAAFVARLGFWPPEGGESPHDYCDCPRCGALDSLYYAISQQQSGGFDVAREADFLRRMARKNGHVAWARMAKLSPWHRKTIELWRALALPCAMEQGDFAFVHL